MRTRLTPADLLRTAGLGVSSRPQRTALAALGVALGIASLVALTGAAASNHAELLASLDAMGADLAVVRPGLGPEGEPVPLPPDTPEIVARQDGVARVGVLESAPPQATVLRSDLVPAHASGGISVLVARPDLLGAVDGEVASGRWFDEATRGLPVTVLGATAADRLGITQAGDRVLVGGQWHAVLGVLEDSGLAGGTIDTAAILGDRWAAAAFPGDHAGQIEAVYVRAEPGRVAQVRVLLAPAASPAAPHLVSVSLLGDLVEARETTDDALATLGLTLAGIALLVGGVGIANTMVVAVMERRGEIGLRRSLGARPGQVAAQFVTEAVMLSALGGLAGAGLGVLAAVVLAVVSDQPLVIPWPALAAGPALSVVVGALAGLQPATRAARVTPTTALRGAV